MKSYKILKTFDGNQTGTGEPQRFEAGTVAQLSDWLAEVAMKDGCAEPAESAGIPVRATEGKVEEIEEVFIGDASIPADSRETKVIEPEETKPAKPKKGKK